MAADQRFSRTRILMGDEACDALARSNVLVCGLGAVGGFALEMLARMGVGSFILADCDCFEISNINRQICALESTIGTRKTETARRRVLEINPGAHIEVFDTFIDESTIPELFATSPAVAVDAIDTVESKISLMRLAPDCDIKLVSSMGAARKTDPSMVKTAPLSKTRACPLAAKIRKTLRTEGRPSDFMCVYSDELPAPDSHLCGGSRKVIGSSPLVTSTFGIRLAHLAVSAILEDALR